MQVEAVVVHLHVIFALTEVKQGHVSLASFSHVVCVAKYWINCYNQFYKLFCQLCRPRGNFTIDTESEKNLSQLSCSGQCGCGVHHIFSFTLNEM